MYVKAVNALLTDKNEILANLALIQKTLFDTTAPETEKVSLQAELAVTADLIQKCIDENASIALDQSDYQQRYEALVVRFNTAQTRINELTDKISEAKARRHKMAGFIDELKKRDGIITEFDDALWHGLVEYATIYSYRDVRFTFKDGSEINAFDSH